MKITKQSASAIQMIGFTTIKELQDYIVVTYPLGFSIEIKDKFIHLRKLDSHEEGGKE